MWRAGRLCHGELTNFRLRYPRGGDGAVLPGEHPLPVYCFNHTPRTTTKCAATPLLIWSIKVDVQLGSTCTLSCACRGDAQSVQGLHTPPSALSLTLPMCVCSRAHQGALSILTTQVLLRVSILGAGRRARLLQAGGRQTLPAHCLQSAAGNSGEPGANPSPRGPE